MNTRELLRLNNDRLSNDAANQIDELVAACRIAADALDDEEPATDAIVELIRAAIARAETS